MAKAKSKPRTTRRAAEEQPRKPPAPVTDAAQARDGEPAYLLALTEARLLVARDRAAKRRRQLAAKHGSAKRSKRRRQLSKATARAAALEAHLADLVAADPRLRALSTNAQPTSGSRARAARPSAGAKPPAGAAKPGAAAAKPAAGATKAISRKPATAGKSAGAAKPATGATKPAAGAAKASGAAKPAARSAKPAAGAAKPAAGSVASKPRPRATAARRSPRAGGNAGHAHEP
jgi:hypothetical protein